MSIESGFKAAKNLVKQASVFGIRPRCPTCGFRIRGANHAEGKHHQQGRKGQCEVK